MAGRELPLLLRGFALIRAAAMLRVSALIRAAAMLRVSALIRAAALVPLLIRAAALAGSQAVRLPGFTPWIFFAAST